MDDGVAKNGVANDIVASTMGSRMLGIAPISASAALDIILLMSWVMLSTAPLFVGIGASFDRKICPPAGLRALGSLKYHTSLCTARIISFLRYVRTASRWVAA